MPANAQPKEKPSWDALYEVAASQAGYFQRSQALEVHYSPPLLEHHIHARKIERVGRGIFRLVHFPPSEHEDLVVVWLWSERFGVFSHETALGLHELSDAMAGRHHLTVPKAWERRRLRVPKNVTLHFDDLVKKDRGWMGPIPATTPLRTLFDCAASSSSPDFVRQAFSQGIKRGLFTRLEAKQQLAAAASTRATGGR